MRILASLLFVFVWGALANAQSSPPLSAYEYEKPARFTDVELSPSGRYLAYKIVSTGKYCFDSDGQMVPLDKGACGEKYKRYRSLHEIKVYDLETSQIVTSIPIPINFLIGSIEWASDDYILAALRSPTTFGRKGRGYTPGASRIVSIPRTGGTLIPLFDNQKNVVRQNRNLSRITNLLRKDPEHVLLPADKDGDLDLWKVNVVSGDAIRIAEGRADTFYWYTDGAGKPVLRYDCNGARCKRVNVYVVGKSEGDWKLIKTFSVKPNDDSSDFPFWPVAPSDNDSQFYVISNEETDARATIKLYDIQTDQFVSTVFEDEKMDVRGAIVNHQTGAFAGAWFYEDRMTYVLNDETEQKHVNALNRYFEDKENVRLLGYDKAGKRLMMHVSAPNNPGEYYLYSFEEQRVERLFRSHPDLGERAETKTDILPIQTRDGETITAYHTYSLTGSGPAVPLLVMPHGGPEVRNTYDYSAQVQYFASRGYQVLQINFRGSSGYGRAFAEAGYGQWGGLMQDDVIDAVKALYDGGKAAPEKACIVGYSYGGYVALYAGAKTPDMFKCVVSGGGVSDIVSDLKRSKVEYGGKSATFEYWEKSMGKLDEDKDALEAASPVNMADLFKAPVLLIHGEFDGNVLPSQSEDMERALKKAGKDVSFIELKDAGRSMWDIETSIIYLEEVESFLQEHLK